MAIPKVFISYSHDSIEHKKWVFDLAVRMRNNGIDAVLDQWELDIGDDLPHFMETHLANSDFIIMICTEIYVEKANTGKGGVGYEKMIITSNLMTSIDENKIIPIIRQTGGYSAPTFLKTKKYINFSKNDDFEYNFDDLIRRIHKSPLYKKPEIGDNPFNQIKENVESKTHDGLLELMKTIAEKYNNQDDDYIDYMELKEDLDITRLTLDFLIDQAVNLEYILYDHNGLIFLKDDGRFYIIENNLQ